MYAQEKKVILNQDFFYRKIDSVVNSKKMFNSKNSYLKRARENNSVNFMNLNALVDAYNTLYKTTCDNKYLKENYQLIETILSNAAKEKVLSGNERHVFLVKDPKSSLYHQEVLLYEGYIFRYIAEFSYLLSQSKWKPTEESEQFDIRTVVEKAFFHWYSKSIKTNGDESLLFHRRIHIGNHWSTVAMFLYLTENNLDKKNIYFNVYEKYNKAVKTNLKLKSRDSIKYYLWNATYDIPFTNTLKRNLVNPDIPQDVTHGNHVVQFIYTSHEYGMGNWKNTDLQYLANTLKMFIWNPKTYSFSDLINGDNSSNPKLKNTGWKQADGWMKLMHYDSSLKEIYEKFYLNTTSKIDKSAANIQFFANFIKFLNDSKE